jgi:probable addiction module antidote protein
MAKRKFRTFGEIEEEYFHKHPEEIDDYLAIIFDEYAKDGDMGALLSSLRRVVRAKGLSTIAGEAELTRNGLQKALSESGHPKFESINAIMRAMGYRLAPQKLKTG